MLCSSLAAWGSVGFTFPSGTSEDLLPPLFGGWGGSWAREAAVSVGAGPRVWGQGLSRPSPPSLVLDLQLD